MLKAERERETREHKAREIRKKAFRELKKRGASQCGSSGREKKKKKALELNKCVDFMNAHHFEDGF